MAPTSALGSEPIPLGGSQYFLEAALLGGWAPGNSIASSRPDEFCFDVQMSLERHVGFRQKGHQRKILLKVQLPS